MNLRAIFPFTWLCVGGLLCGSLGGCVERKLSVTSEPSGAVVYMNDKEVGRTPFVTDFIWYGNYDVQVRKDGYLTLDKPTQLKTPWWEYPPLDLFAEFAPWHPTDRQAVHYVLKPRPANDRPPEDIIGRGVALGKLMESPDRPMPHQVPVPATQATPPVTRP